MPLATARSGEVRLATSDEMDLAAAVWLVPGARMKAKRGHRVPISARALAILRDARSLGDGTGLVFPSPRGKPLSDMTLSKLIKELGLPADLNPIWRDHPDIVDAKVNVSPMILYGLTLC